MNHNYFYVIKTVHFEKDGRTIEDFDAIYPNRESAVEAIRRNCMDLSECGYNQMVTLWNGAYGCYPHLELDSVWSWDKETNRYKRIDFKDETN